MSLPYGTASSPAIFSPSDNRALPIVVHIPHASRVIPDTDSETLGLAGEQLSLELGRVTDDHLDRAFSVASHLGATVLVHRVSRLLVDPCRERAAAVSSPATDEEAPGAPALSTDATEGRLIAYYDTYITALRGAVAAAVDRFGQCLLIEAGTFEGNPPADSGETDGRIVRIGTVAEHDLEWLLSHWQEHLDKKRIEQFDIESGKAGAPLAALQAAFGAQLSFMRIELGRHTYLDPEDGYCFAPWREGPDFLHFLLSRAADLVDERCGYPREEMTRDQAQSFAVDHRLMSGGLPPVRRVVAWKELELKPHVACVTASEIHDCWVVLYERSPRVAPDTHLFCLFHRITGAPQFLGVRYDVP